jgi:hypothetical protein
MSEEPTKPKPPTHKEAVELLSENTAARGVKN